MLCLAQDNAAGFFSTALQTGIGFAGANLFISTINHITESIRLLVFGLEDMRNQLRVVQQEGERSL